MSETEKPWSFECPEHKVKSEGLPKFKAEQLQAVDSAKVHHPRYGFKPARMYQP